MFGRGLKTLSLLSVALIVGAFALVFFYAPNDADQGFIQKIFYLHVPLAIVALCGFVAGGIYGIRYLRSGDRLHDLRSYVAIHLSLIFGVGALVTGSIWAKASWGHWWLWDEPTLVSFLIVFLLYACYQPLRFSIEDPERQARYAAVFAIVAGAFVPLNFMAVRMARVARAPARARRPPAARCRARCGSRSWSRWSAMALPVRDAVEVRAGLQARRRSGCARSSASSPATRTSGPRNPRRSAAPSSSDARAPARRGRQVRRRRLPGLPRPGPDLRRDHGGAGWRGSSGIWARSPSCWSAARGRRSDDERETVAR